MPRGPQLAFLFSNPLPRAPAAPQRPRNGPAQEPPAPPLSPHKGRGGGGVGVRFLFARVLPRSLNRRTPPGGTRCHVAALKKPKESNLDLLEFSSWPRSPQKGRGGVPGGWCSREEEGDHRGNT